MLGVERSSPVQYFVLNKPAGCISARRDFAGRPTLYDHIPTHFPALPHVGRLDYATEGLMLFTDDGLLAQAVLNPKVGETVEKVYRVKVRDRLDPSDHRIALLERPLVFRSGPVTNPARARFLEHRTRSTWIEVVLTDGRNRQIRRLCDRSGLQVLKLRRVQIGPLKLGDLTLRWCRPLAPAEVSDLYDAALPKGPRARFVPIDDSPVARASRPPDRTPC
jgi:23S rRNA pseudouridine2605 synthase